MLTKQFHSLSDKLPCVISMEKKTKNCKIQVLDKKTERRLRKQRKKEKERLKLLEKERELKAEAKGKRKGALAENERTKRSVVIQYYDYEVYIFSTPLSDWLRVAAVT